MASPARAYFLMVGVPLLFVVALLSLFPASAYAGMPMMELTDVTRLRVQTISFFLAGLLLSAGLIQFLWNYLRKDFTFLPRLTYGKALSVVVLWGLLFILVLTIISGARELMTPGAWEKQGATYRLSDHPISSATSESPPSQPSDYERQNQLIRLRTALWEYAKLHDGRFPLDRSAPEIPGERWQLPDASGMQYRFIGAAKANDGHQVLAYEPELYHGPRFVLFTDGEIKALDSEILGHLLPPEKRK